MADVGETLLTAAEELLLRGLVAAVPAIGRLLRSALSGDPPAVRKVTDILPERSASQEVAEELRHGS